MSRPLHSMGLVFNVFGQRIETSESWQGHRHPAACSLGTSHLDQAEERYVSRPMDEAAEVLTDPTAFADERIDYSPRWHTCGPTAPVTWVDQPPYRPFWAITKHADILEIERNTTCGSTNHGRTWSRQNGRRNRAQRRDGTGVRLLVETDGQRHRRVRTIGTEWFRPKAMRTSKAEVDHLAKRYVDHMRGRSECDFVGDIAVNYPLYVIISYWACRKQISPAASVDPGGIRSERRRASAGSDGRGHP